MKDCEGFERFDKEIFEFIEKKFGAEGSDLTEEKKVEKRKFVSKFEFWKKQKMHKTDEKKFEHPYDFTMDELPQRNDQETTE